MPRSPTPEKRVESSRPHRENRYERALGYDTDDERAGSSSRRHRDERERDKKRVKHRDDEWRSGRDDKDSGRDERTREERRERKKDERRERKKDERRGEDRDKKDRKEKRREGSRSPSPSDRRRRKAAKAESKLNSRRNQEADQAREVAELSLYTGADNPFHDANIGQQFVWKKKEEKEKKAGLTAEEIARKDHRRRLEAKEELEKLNKRRADREVEMQLKEQEESRMARLAEDGQMRQWIAREDDFQLEQSRRRAGIRLREQRAKAIDFLAINLRFADAKALGRHTAAIGALANPRKYEAEREEEAEGWGWADAGFEFEIDEPWRIFDNLNLEDCEELEEDINMYLSLEKSAINMEFWQELKIVCQHHLQDLRDPEHAEGGRLFNKDVDVAAGKVVSGLSHRRLVELENKTNAMLRSGQPVDGEFWESVLRKIDVEKAIAKLNAIHEVVLKNRLEQFKKRQRDNAMKAGEIGQRTTTGEGGTFGGDMQAEQDDDGGVEADDEVDEDDWVEEYDPEMSPPPVLVRDLALDDRRLPIIEEEDHLRAIYAARRALIASDRPSKSDFDQSQMHTNKSVSRPSQADLEAERMVREEAQQEGGLRTDESEEEFGDLEDSLGLGPVIPLDWSDRYRPRKPRYFNRVLTGFEWNRYNQTHYDHDNPPPKVVTGYRFNIFYPDLIDKSQAPTYYTQRIPDDEDTQMLVFTAGPPYEDIAFRIVRRPWQYSHRYGFRSLFDRGIIQLYFQFARYY